MATKVVTDPTGAVSIADTANSGNLIDDLASNVLGKQVNTKDNSTQDTSAGTTSNTAGSQTGATTGTTAGNTATTGQQTTAGSTTGTSQLTGVQGIVGATTGSTATTGSQQVTGSTGNTSAVSGNQTTAGVTANTQAQTGQQSGTASTSTDGTTTGSSNTRTGGTTTSTTGGTVSNNQTQTSTANTADLQDVFNRQSAGITPDMLKAIFQQGSKAAPNLVLAQSNALGARGDGNSPMAQVLNQLNVELTSKAADINRQLLSDASGTAAHIADLTKSLNTSGSQTTNNTSTQVQDLLTHTDSSQVIQQLANTINAQNTSSNISGSGTSGQTTGTNQLTSQAGTSSQGTVSAQNTAQAGTSNQATNSSQNTATSGTQQQAVGTTQNTAQTGTTSGTTQQASNQSAVGTQNQHVAASDTKTQQTTINTSVVKSLAGLAIAGVGLDQILKAATGKGFVGTVQDLYAYLTREGVKNINLGDAGIAAPNVAGALTPLTNPGDNGDLLDPLINPSDGPGIGDVIGKLTGFADGGKVDFLPVPDLISKKTTYEPPDHDVAAMLAGMGLGDVSGSKAASAAAPQSKGAAGADQEVGGGNGSTGSAASIGTIGTPSGGTGISTATASTVGSVVGAILGLPSGLIGKAAAFANDQVNSLNQSQIAQTKAEQDAYNITETNQADPVADAPSDAPSDGDAPSGVGDGNGDGSAYADGGNGFNLDGQPDSPTGHAAGTSDADSDPEELLSATSLDGSTVFNEDSVNKMVSVLQRNPAQGYADGGRLIQGPGTGVSDSIPAVGPNGQSMRVSHGEYILPADVVAHLGVDHLNALVASLHTPASVQRMNNG